MDFYTSFAFYVVAGIVIAICIVLLLAAFLSENKADNIVSQVWYTYFGDRKKDD